MSLVINGKTYKIVCLNGKEYSRGYFNGRLVLNVPDNNAYLWAGPGVRLAADDASAVSYLNTPQIISNTLSGAAIGLQTFSLSFYVHKDAVETGTVRLLELPGVVSVKSEAAALAFKFAWEKNPVWRFCKTTDLVPGWNKVTLAKTGKKLTVSVNTHEYILADHTTSTPVKNKIYRGFSTDRYISISAAAPNSADTVFLNVIPDKIASYSRQTIGSYYSNSDVRLCMNSSGKLFFYSGGYTYPADYALTEGQRYWIKLFSATVGVMANRFSLAIAPDNNTASLDDVVNGTAPIQWTVFNELKSDYYQNSTEWRAGPYHFGGDGYSNSSSYIWQGGIDMAKMAYCANGNILWDGRKDTYSVANSSSSGWTVDEQQNKPDLPDLPAPGPLSVTPGWMKVKDVRAELN